MVVITVPKVLREKLGEDGTDSLVELINQSEVKSKEDVLKFIEEKFEKRLTLEASQINERITTEISKVNNNISEAKSEIIKWMFIFWAGQIGVLLGLLFAFFKR
ncbi:MAG: hypothetical protein ACC651_11010 [Candidatus Scalindua sp.]